MGTTDAKVRGGKVRTRKGREGMKQSGDDGREQSYDAGMRSVSETDGDIEKLFLWVDKDDFRWKRTISHSYSETGTIQDRHWPEQSGMTA